MIILNDVDGTAYVSESATRSDDEAKSFSESFTEKGRYLNQEAIFNIVASRIK